MRLPSELGESSPNISANIGVAETSAACGIFCVMRLTGVSEITSWGGTRASDIQMWLAGRNVPMWFDRLLPDTSVKLEVLETNAETHKRDQHQTYSVRVRDLRCTEVAGTRFLARQQRA